MPHEVEPQSALILVGLLDSRPLKVVGGAVSGGQRIPLQQCRSHRIDAVARNDAARERQASCAAAGQRPRRGRIEDRRHASGHGLGEDTLTLQPRRHCGDDRAPDRLPLGLIVSEREEAIASQGTADNAAPLLAPVLRPGITRRREHRPCRERLVPHEIEERALGPVGAAARHDRHDPAIEPAELGRRTVGLDPHLVHRLDARHDRHLAGFGLQHRHAVHQILVGARSPAVDAGKRRSRGQGHARGQADERDESPADQREGHRDGLFHDAAEAGRLTSGRRGGRADDHLRGDRRRRRFAGGRHGVVLRWRGSRLRDRYLPGRLGADECRTHHRCHQCRADDGAAVQAKRPRHDSTL